MKPINHTQLSLTVNGKDKTAHYDGSLDSGDAYSFNLTLKDNDLILTPTGTLPDWGTADEEETIQ